MLNFVIKLFSCSSFYDLWTRQFHHTIVFVYELAVFFGSMLGLFGHSPLTWARRTSMFLSLILYIDVLFNLFMTHVLHLPCLLRPLYCPLDFLLSQCPFLVPWLYFRAVSLILEALYFCSFRSFLPFNISPLSFSVSHVCLPRFLFRLFQWHPRGRWPPRPARRARRQRVISTRRPRAPWGRPMQGPPPRPAPRKSSRGDRLVFVQTVFWVLFVEPCFFFSSSFCGSAYLFVLLLCVCFIIQPLTFLKKI